MLVISDFPGVAAHQHQHLPRPGAELAWPHVPMASSSRQCFHGEAKVLAATAPEAATAGTPIPGKVESPQHSSPDTICHTLSVGCELLAALRASEGQSLCDCDSEERA